MEYGRTFTSNGFVIKQIEALENGELQLVRAGLCARARAHQDFYVATKLAASATDSSSRPPEIKSAKPNSPNCKRS